MVSRKQAIRLVHTTCEAIDRWLAFSPKPVPLPPNDECMVRAVYDLLRKGAWDESGIDQLCNAAACMLTYGHDCMDLLENRLTWARDQQHAERGPCNRLRAREAVMSKALDTGTMLVLASSAYTPAALRDIDLVTAMADATQRHSMLMSDLQRVFGKLPYETPGMVAPPPSDLSPVLLAAQRVEQAQRLSTRVSLNWASVLVNMAPDMSMCEHGGAHGPGTCLHYFILWDTLQLNDMCKRDANRARNLLARVLARPDAAMHRARHDLMLHLACLDVSPERLVSAGVTLADLQEIRYPESRPKHRCPCGHWVPSRPGAGAVRTEVATSAAAPPIRKHVVIDLTS